MRVRSFSLSTAAMFGALVLAVSACSSSTDAETSGIRVVDAATAADLLEAEPAPTLVDVRTPGEYAEGHLEDAVLIDYNAPDFRDQIAELPRDGSYVIYCRSGNRSEGARDVMAELGFTDVTDIEGGIVAWSAAGLPVTTS